MSVLDFLNQEQDEFVHELCFELLDVDQMTWTTRLSETQSMFFSKYKFEIPLQEIKTLYFDILHNQDKEST